MVKNKNIPDHIPASTESYVSWGDSMESRKEASIAFGRALDAVQPIPTNRSSGSFTPSFMGPDNSRQGMTRYDYEFFRPYESVPKGWKEILLACMGAYDRVGVIRNVIDLMADFTSQGIKLVHPNSQVEKFYQTWFKHVDGQDRSERFANLLYRSARTIVKRDFAKLPAKVIDELQRGIAEINVTDDQDIYDLKAEPKGTQTKNVIPYSYHFLNPELVDVVGGDLGLFTGNVQYVIWVPPKLASTISNPRTPEEIDMVADLPPYIVNPIRAGQKRILLDPSRVSVFHYKKDDWVAWGLPMTYAVMDDIILLQKMKLCDLAALDGAISHIRIWKLGSLPDKIFPTEHAIHKLHNVLMHAGNAQSFDLIWGPDITVEETKTDIQNFLGKAKYEPVLSSLYSGLGIPSTITGGGEKGFTNNFLSLKTLIERLNYGRDILVKFWNAEIKLVQQAMRFRFPAQVEFKHMILTDEAAQNQLLINLLDRDVIGLDTVREQFGFIPEVEAAAVKNDYKQRTNKKIPPKAGVFHDAQPDLALEKIALQTGLVTPTEVGLELDPRKRGEKTSLDLKLESQKVMKQNNDGPVGQPGQGRPPGKKDEVPRKPKRVLPRSKADGTGTGSEFINLSLWAKEAQQMISDLITPEYLKMCNKKNVRSLSTAEVESLEHFKFAILCNTPPYIKITSDSIGELISKPFPKYKEAEDYWRVLVADLYHKKQSQPTIDEIRQIQSHVYALYMGPGELDGQSECSD